MVVEKLDRQLFEMPIGFEKKVLKSAKKVISFSM